MPKHIERSIALEDKWYPDGYWLWNQIDIWRRWREEPVLKDFVNLEEEESIIIVYCDVSLAPILTALFMREVHDSVDSTWYDVDTHRLFLYYGLRALGAMSDKEERWVLRECKERTIKVIDHVFKHKAPESIRMDLNGAPLFARLPDPPHAHMNYGIPKTASNTTPLA